jgi:AraC-like DNA-binding protein
MQIPPIPQLSHLVRHFLILESAGTERVLHRLIPDGNPGIVFHFGALFEPFPRSFAYGPITRPQNIVSDGPIGVFVVVLQPYAMSLLTNRPAHTFVNSVLSLHEFRGGLVAERRLLYCTSHQQRLDVIQRFLLRFEPLSPDPMVSYSLQWLEEHEAPAIEELAGELSVGRRTLERAFQSTIGISPKQYAGILRTQHFLKALSCVHAESITGLAYEFGYYDQSHLIRDFKTRTGITPGRYVAGGALALNFIRVTG